MVILYTHQKILCALFLSLIQITIPQSLSTKKGIVETTTIRSVRLLNATWYYNYKTEHTRKQTGVTFIPMIQSAASHFTLSAAPEALLGFNEPDVSTGSSLSPEEAVSLWPRVEATSARRIGAPACTRHHIFSWLPPFLLGNSTYAPRVDFIPLHWYDRNASDFLLFINSVWTTFRKPLWITEFSIADWTASSIKPSQLSDKDVLEFIYEVIPALEQLPFVEKYAWYSDLNNPAISFASLWNKNNSITSAGKAYSQPYSPPTPAHLTSGSCSSDGSSYHYEEEIMFKRKKRSLRYNGCPNHMCVCQQANCGGERNTRAKAYSGSADIPLFPHMAVHTQHMDVPNSMVGVALNGVPIHSGPTSPEEAVDACGGWAGAADGRYRYSQPPPCLIAQLQRPPDVTAPQSTQRPPGVTAPLVPTHSALIGWALDGFPIYGPIGFKGIPMYRCSHALAHAEICLDECNGLFAELRKVDDFMYRYYLTGPVGDAMCSDYTANWGHCPRPDNPCCINTLPDATISPSISCFKGCAYNNPGCQNSNTKGFTPNFYPNVSSFPSEVYSLRPRISATSNISSYNNFNTTLNSTSVILNPDGTESVISFPVKNSQVIIRFPRNNSLAIITKFFDTSSGKGTVSTEILPSSSKDALIGSITSSDAVILFTTRFGVFSVPEQGGKLRCIISGYVPVVIRGFNLGSSVDSIVAIKLGSQMQISCSNIVLVSSNEVKCVYIMQQQRYQGSDYNLDLGTLLDTLQLETTSGVLTSVPIFSGNDMTYSVDDIVSGSGRPVITSIGGIGATAGPVIEPFYPHAVCSSIKQLNPQFIAYFSDFESKSILAIDDKTPPSLYTIKSGVPKVLSICTASLEMFNPSIRAEIYDHLGMINAFVEEIIFYIDAVRRIIAFVVPQALSAVDPFDLNGPEYIILSGLDWVKSLAVESFKSSGDCILLALLSNGSLLKINLHKYMLQLFSRELKTIDIRVDPLPSWLKLIAIQGATSKSRYSSLTILPDNHRVGNAKSNSSDLLEDRILRRVLISNTNEGYIVSPIRSQRCALSESYTRLCASSKGNILFNGNTNSVLWPTALTTRTISENEEASRSYLYVAEVLGKIWRLEVIGESDSIYLNKVLSFQSDTSRGSVKEILNILDLSDFALSQIVRRKKQGRNEITGAYNDLFFEILE